MAYTDPSSISGLLRWGKADAEAYANNDPVGTYHDQSGNSRDFIASAGARPTFKTNIKNGLPAILWNGSANVMTFDALGATLSGTNTPFTFFCVFQHSTLAVLHQCFFIFANITGSSTPTHDLFWRGESFNWNCDRRDDAATEKHVQGQTSDTNWHTIILTFDGSSGALYIDGVLVSLSDQSAGAMTVNSASYGAHRRVDGTDSYFNGYWGEDGIYNSALSGTSTIGNAAPPGTDVYNTHNYLQAKWASSNPVSTWEPYRIGNTLQAWFRDDSWGFLSDGTSATTWFSKVGKTTAAFLDAVGTGTYKTAIINGLSTVLLNGSTNRYLNNTIASSYLSGTSVPFTIFGSFKATSVAAAQEVFGAGRSSGGDVSLHRLQLSATPQYRIDRRADNNVLVSQTAGTPDTSAHTFIHSFDGTNVTLYIDGTAIINNLSLATSGANTLDLFTIGALHRSLFIEFFTGYIGEIGVISAATTGSTLTSLKNYLTRWGTYSTSAGTLLSRRRKGVLAA